MTTNFPAGLDDFVNPAGTSLLTSPDHAGLHTDVNDAVEALEAKVGVDGSLVTSSLDYKFNNDVVLKSVVDAKGDLLVGTAADSVARLAVGVTNGHVLTVDSGEPSGIKWAAAAGGNGVTISEFLLMGG
jgi:hypothetical protein